MNPKHQISTNTGWRPASQWLAEHPGLFTPQNFYAKLGSGEIPHVRIGRRYFVRYDLLDRLEVEQNRDRANR